MVTVKERLKEYKDKHYGKDGYCTSEDIEQCVCLESMLYRALKICEQEITEKDITINTKNMCIDSANNYMSIVIKENEQLKKDNEKMKQNQLFHKDFDGVETYFGEGDWLGYTEQRPWIQMYKIKNFPICDCLKPCGWYLGHYWTHSEYLKKKGKK
ncbi:hypothetical protein SSYRP_v1c04500 [Spiroplasma syrphidicola EA-1]|uniref:Uncharacterized protein n=1 Tax=Spiroplasma syrphidicola EA-1 TaxID=1276229 RepID=R4U3P8_9MOLU|nr:hypothetical protein [Spiroplasma syrphidicola]AGM26042.1 hypothetical protein SSYRP_v1c04500 [Spiroplasma syrphidicola EA-1]